LLEEQMAPSDRLSLNWIIVSVDLYTVL